MRSNMAINMHYSQRVLFYSYLLRNLNVKLLMRFIFSYGHSSFKDLNEYLDIFFPFLCTKTNEKCTKEINYFPTYMAKIS